MIDNDQIYGVLTQMLQAQLSQQSLLQQQTAHLATGLDMSANTLSADIPLQYRMVSSTPQNFNNPLLNSVYNSSVPFMASLVTGAQFMQEPTFDIGTGAARAYYARDYTEPVYTAGRQQLTQAAAQGLGVTAAQIGNRLGLRPDDMSYNEFIGRGANIGGHLSPIMEGLMETKGFQSVMGGDYKQFYDNLFPRFRELSQAPGTSALAFGNPYSDDPMERAQYTEAHVAMNRAGADFAQSLQDRILSYAPDPSRPEERVRSLTPDVEFTRGYQAEEIAGLANILTQRNAVAGFDEFGNEIGFRGLLDPEAYMDKGLQFQAMQDFLMRPDIEGGDQLREQLADTFYNAESEEEGIRAVNAMVQNDPAFQQYEAGLTQAASEAGAMAMRDNIQQGQDTIEKYAKALSAVGEVVNKSDMASAVAKLEQFTGGQWTEIDPQLIEDTMDNIRGTALMLNTTSEKMLEGIISTQQTIRNITGETVSATGAVAGAGGNMPIMGQILEERIQMMAQADPTRREADVSQDVMRMFEMGQNSSSGRNARAISFLNQEGEVNPELYREYEQAVLTGNKTEQAALESEIFAQSSFAGIGNRAQIMEWLDIDANMTAVQNRMTAGTQVEAEMLINVGQQNELGERDRQKATRRQQAIARQISSRTGMSLDTGLTDDEMAYEQFQNMQEVLNDRLVEENPELAAQMTGQMERVYERAGGGQEGLMAVQEYAASSELIKPFAGAMRQAAAATESEILLSEVQKDPEKYQQAASIQKQAQLMVNSRAMSDKDQREITAALEKGDVITAEAILNTHKSKLGVDERAILGEAGTMAKEGIAKMAEIGLADNTAVDRIRTEGAYGLNIQDRKFLESELYQEQMNPEVVERFRRGADELGISMGDYRHRYINQAKTMSQKALDFSTGKIGAFDFLGLEVLPTEIKGPDGAILTPDQVMTMTEEDMAGLDEETQDHIKALQQFGAIDSPEKLMKMTDEDVEALPPAERMIVEQAKEMVGSEKFGHAKVVAKAAELAPALVEAEQTHLLDEGGGTGIWKELAGIKTEKELKERLGFKWYKNDSMDPAIKEAWELTQTAEGQAALGALPQLKEVESTDEEKAEVKRGAPSQTMKLSGTVTLRGGSSGSKVLDFEGAELNSN